MDGIQLAFFVLCGLLGSLIGYAAYDSITAETFELRKDSWRCTASHTDTTVVPIMTGSTTVMVPQSSTVCDRWERK